MTIPRLLGFRVNAGPAGRAAGRPRRLCANPDRGHHYAP